MKLVRDKIPEIIRNNGKTPRVHIADDEEYWRMLVEKLHEEVNEFSEAENAEELADVLEVIDAIIAHRFDKTAVKEIQDAKREKRGGFTKRIIWEGN